MFVRSFVCSSLSSHVYMLVCFCVHPPACFFVSSFISSSFRSVVRSSVRLFVRPSVRLFVYFFIFLFFYLLVHSSVRSLGPSVCTFTLMLTYKLTTAPRHGSFVGPLALRSPAHFPLLWLVRLFVRTSGPPFIWSFVPSHARSVISSLFPLFARMPVHSSSAQSPVYLLFVGPFVRSFVCLFVLLFIMCVCVCVCVRARVYVCVVCACVCAWACACACACVRARARACVCVLCARVCARGRGRVRVRVCARVHVRARARACGQARMCCLVILPR